MIVILRQDPDKAQLDSLITWLKGKGMDVHESRGTSQLVLGLVGDTTQIDIDLISALDIVEDVKRVQEPYKAASRKFHPDDSVEFDPFAQIGRLVLKHCAKGNMELPFLIPHRRGQPDPQRIIQIDK